MKLLRDFFRLRTANSPRPGARGDASRRTWTITVPEPLVKSTPAAPWHEPEAPKSHRHLQLISSH